MMCGGGGHIRHGVMKSIMTNERAIETFQLKAYENLAAAESELANSRYNTSVSRCYYASFQAAIVALLQAGVRLPGADMFWGHNVVQAQFAGELIRRRKQYPSELRTVLPRLIDLRHIADYEIDVVSRTQAERAVRRARGFVTTVLMRGDGSA